MIKFSSPLDKAIYTASLDWWTDDEIWDDQGFGWYGLGYFSPDDEKYFRDLEAKHKFGLTEDDFEMIRTYAGAIIFINNQGFVDVSYYEDEDELDEDWHEIVLASLEDEE